MLNCPLPLDLVCGGCYCCCVVEILYTTHHTNLIMELTKSFPPADDLLVQLQEIDYKKLLNDYMDVVVIVCATVAAVCVVIWERLQTVKITTPTFLTEYFYFNLNLRYAEGDEIVGLSVGNRYIGLYTGTIVWGELDERGVLLCQ